VLISHHLTYPLLRNGSLPLSRFAAERTLSRLSRTFAADFWRLWSIGLISSIVRWIDTVVVGVVASGALGLALLLALRPLWRTI
jgi:hypothetical protein